ncbi:serine hydrolase [Methylosinus sp. Ce-a6]|uniref:serine hydrolase domain-containing protein n=1 Tax=Methylosinus sp. Ce-a6 TaxID=2172005 RepID=UPI00135CAA3A|nr:serine hydrolase domain-containing protein [Methylosinus sp. Ce-a6]
METGAFIDEAGGVTLSGGVDPAPWWSFTKTVLAIAALRLVESGALSLSEPIAGARYDLRQLLRHEAGLPDYGSSPRYREDVAAAREPWPVERLLAEIEADRLRYEPGTGWAYSNIGYLEVARSIERAFGSPLAAALRQLVFAPAGLTTARLATTPADLTGVRMGSAGDYHPGWVYHGLVVGTVQDAARLLWTLMSDGLIGRDMRVAMLEGRSLPEHRSALHPDPAYGLGLMLSATDPMEHPLGHSGEGPGSRIAVYARGRKAAAVWTASPSKRVAETEVFRFLAE